MEELNRAFGEYMDEFKNLDIKRKKIEILRSIEELTAIFEELGKIDNINLKHLKVDDQKNSIDTEDNFLNTEFLYIEDAKNLIGQYLDQKN